MHPLSRTIESDRSRSSNAATRYPIALCASMLLVAGLLEADDSPITIGGTVIGSTTQAAPPVVHDGMDNDPCDHCGNSDPIELATGEFKLDRTDLVLPGLNEALEVAFRYRSQRMVNGAWGFGWVPSFEQRLFVRSDGDVVWRVGSGDRIRFSPAGSSTYEPVDEKFHVTLTAFASAWRIDELLTGNVYLFDDNGLLLQTIDRRGNATTFTWDTDGGAAPVKFPVGGVDYITAFDYRVKTIESTLGKLVTFTYFTAPSWKLGRLERIDDGYGRSVKFDYDVRGDLVTVRSPVTTYLDGGIEVTRERTTTYGYTSGHGDPRTNAPESVLDHNLESITDDRGLVQLFNEYDNNDRVVAQSAHGGTSTYTYQATYLGDITIVDEVDGNGYKHRHKFDTDRNPIEVQTTSAGIHPGLGALVLTKYGYNGVGEASTITFPLGNGIERTYVDGKMTSLTRRQVMAQPTSPAITWSYAYNQVKPYRPLESVLDPLGNVTTYRYDFEEASVGDLNEDGVTDQDMGNVVRVEFPDLTLPDGSTILTPVQRKFQYNAQGQLTRGIDEEGRVTDYSYFPSGHASYGLLQSVTVDPLGLALTTTFTYDAFGFVDLVTDPRGNVTDHDHNAVGELVRVAGPEGVEQRFAYDANGNLVRTQTRNLDESGAVQSPEWIVRTCQYDAWNRLTSCTEDVTGSTTRTTTYAYDFLGNLSQVTTPEGRVQTFEYDERGVLWRQVRGAGTPLSSTRRWHVDKNGNVVQSIDGRGGLTTIVRDLFDRATAIVDPAGNRTELLLSERDEVLQRELFDPLAPSLPMVRTLQEFDEQGRLVKSIADPVGGGVQSQTWFERDRTGLVTRRRSPRGEFTVFGHDGAGRLVSVVDPLQNELQYTLDDNGNPQVVTSVEQAPGGQESYALETVFDGQDRPTVRRRYAQGVPVGTGTPLSTSFAWDSRHQLATVTDPIGRVLRTTYDLAGRPTSTVEDEGGLALTTGYVHDQDDLLTTLTDPDGKPTGWIHDSLGRVREIDYALGGSELFTHDGEDAVVTHTRQDAVVTTLTYRADGALSSRTVGAQREEFDWAAVGVPREARVLSSGLVRSRVSRSFDGLGRVQSESQDDFTLTLGYDPSHNPITIQWPDGYTLTQAFDELERLEGLSDPGGAVADWTWSGPGRVAGRRTGQSLGLVTTYQWDPFQRLSGLDTGAVHDVAYGFDALDRRCWKQSQHLSGQPIDVYGYDGGSRLVDVWKDAGVAVCAQAPSTWASHFDLTLSPGEDRTQTALDEGGGPVTTSYNSGAVDALHRYTNVGGTARLHDGKGNLTGDGALTYEYDAWNRLTAVKASGVERARYEHDALGRRTKKIEPGLVTEYVYSGARLIAEYESVPPAAPQLARRYLHGVGLDELVALDSGGNRYFAFGDALGSVEALTNGTGSVAEWYRYDAFGSATVMDASEVPFALNAYGQPQSPLGNALWFTGARFDGESGQYHMRARQYEPTTGRFTGRDPLGYVDSANAYLYGFNDPANWIDPFGMEAQSGPRTPWRDLTQEEKNQRMRDARQAAWDQNRARLQQQAEIQNAIRRKMPDLYVPYGARHEDLLAQSAATTFDIATKATALAAGVGKPAAILVDVVGVGLAWVDRSCTPLELTYSAADIKAASQEPWQETVANLASSGGMLLLARAHPGMGALALAGVMADRLVNAEDVDFWETLGEATGLALFGYLSGGEFRFGRNCRVAPFGNRTGHPTGKYPHYHRTRQGPDGATLPGQGLKRHRPWDKKSLDKSIWDQF